MKKVAIILLLITSQTLLTKAQCTFEKIFPLKHGVSKFKATTILASAHNIKADKKMNQENTFTPWNKPEYLKGDSVFKTNIHYSYINHDCFKADKNQLILVFSDDKLYKMDIELTFSNSGFENCMKTYKELIAIFKTQYSDWSENVINNSATNEQIGEGYWFYPTSKKERDSVKLEEISIYFKVIYEKQWSEYRQKYITTGNVESYVIEIQSINLKNTKLTNEGY